MKKDESLLQIWLLWVGLTTVVGVGETWIMLALITSAIAQGSDALIFYVVLPPFLLIISFSVGVTQALLLGIWLQKWKGWALASSAGMLISVPLFLFILLDGAMFWQTTLLLGVGAALVGAGVGFTQARLMGLLRRQRSQWTLASALCWGVTWPLSLQGFYQLQVLNILSPTRFGALPTCGGVWFCLSLITGSALLLLLHRELKYVDEYPRS